MLEGADEGRELPGRVGMAAEERSPVEAAEPHRGVLQREWIAPERAQPPLDELAVVARLGEVLLVDVSESVVAGELRAALEEGDALGLDRMRVGEGLAELLAQVVLTLGLQRGVDRDVERRL